MKKRLLTIPIILMAVAFALNISFRLLPTSAPNDALAQSVPCYFIQGGTKLVAASGCEWEMRSGSTLDVQAGTNVTWAPNIAFSGVLTASSLVVSGTSDLQGNVSSSVGVLTITDNILVDGQADTIQLTVQGYTTQTNNLLTLEQSDGTDVLTITNAGNIATAGTLALENIAFSGPVRFGSTANVSNNTLIAHGMGTTPTTVILTPLEAGAFTQTVSLSATNATSFTVRISTGAATPTVYWMAGK